MEDIKENEGKSVLELIKVFENSKIQRSTFQKREVKAQDLQSQHLLIQRKSPAKNTTDTQEIPIPLLDIVDIPDDCDDSATVYFPDHKIFYKSNWRWNEDKQKLCVEAAKDSLNENQVTADEFLHNKSQEEENSELCTVEVQGFEPQDAEICRSYFENSLEGGRKEIVLLSVCEDKMYITFKTSKAAENSSGRSHEPISGQHVQVSRLTPLGPIYQNMILMKNVDEITNKDDLPMLLENITGFKPQEILQGEQPGIVLVKFEQNIDFDKIKELCKEIMLPLSVSQVPISNCMLVENLAPGATEKDVFELMKLCKPRDLIDDPSTAVERVEPMTDENKCLVFFKDGEVIKGIMADGNTRNDKLVLKHYMTCLGLDSDSGMLTTVTKSFILTPGDPYKMAYLQQLKTAQDELVIQLRPLHAQLKIVDNSVIVECTLTSSVYMAHGLARTWTYYVHLTFHKYMNQLEVYKVKIISAIWQEIQTYVANINKQNNGDAIFFMRLTRHIVIVVGKSSARGLFQGLQKTVRDIEIRRMNQVILETEKCFKRYQLQLLKTVNFHDIIKTHNNGITVNIYPNKPEISFSGFPGDVKMAYIETIRVLNVVKSRSMSDKSKSYRHILSSNQTIKLLAKKFSDRNVFAVFDTSDDNIMIYAFADIEIKNAKRCIRETIVELVYSLNEVSIHLLSSEEWHNIIQTHMFKNPGKLHISNFEQPHQFLLTGTIDIMNDVVKCIDDFVNENTIHSEEYCLSPSRQKFVTIQWRDKLKSIETSLTKYKVEILEEKEKDEVICVNGTETGLNLVMRKLQSLGQEITCHGTMVDDPVRVKFFTEEESCKRLDLFERSSKCVVGFSDEPNVLKIVKSNRYGGADDVCFIGDMNIISSVQLSEGVTIFLVQGELSQMVADALVSEINDQMENFKELTRHVASKVSEGEIITSGPGQLLCKQIIYAVSIVYKDGKSGEDERLFETVSKCLQTADISGFTSIALPALGSSTHSSNYPLTECTSEVVKTLKTYVEIHNPSNIKAIYLCAHNSDCVQEFSSALQDVLPHNVPNDSKTRNRDKERSPALKAVVSLSDFTTSSLWEGSFECIMYNLRFMIRQADITEENVDVIVNSTNDNLDLNMGVVSRVLKAKCGAGLENEFKEKVSDMKTNGICSTKAFNLKCKIIIHVNSSRYHADLEGGIKAILKEADKLSLHSIAFPALGTDFHHVTPEESAKAMFRALVSFSKGKRETLNEVRVVLFDNSTVAPFVSAIQARVSKLSSEKRVIGNLFKGKKGRTTPGEVAMVNSLHQVARFYVYAVDKSDVQRLLDDVALAQPSQSVSSSHTPVELQFEEFRRKEFPNKTSSMKINLQPYYGMVERGTVLNECPKLEEEGLNEFLEETTTNIFLLPFISDSWQMSSEFSSKGGQMQEQNSDVVLYVPENAIQSSSYVTIRSAVSTNLEMAHEWFGLDSEEMIVSPVAEFTVEPNIPFKKSVWVILPHFLTQPYSPEHVNVYRFQNKILERLQFEPKDERTSVSEGNQRDGFSVIKEGKIYIYSSHFTGFFCTQCKRQLEPDQLYLRAYGQYTQRDKREVKLLLFVWDGRLNIKDFEKDFLIGREKTYEVQKLGQLDAAPKDQKVCLGIEFLMQGNIRNTWNFTEMDGHQLFPPTTTRNLENILCHSHLQKRARSKRGKEFPCCCYNRKPLRIEWALEERSECMPSKWFQCAIRVGYSTTFDPEPLNFLENARIETLHVNDIELKEAKNSFSQTDSCETHESRAARPSSIPSFNEGFQPSSPQPMITLPHYTINNIHVNRLNGQVIAANENVQHSISATILQNNLACLSDFSVKSHHCFSWLH